MYSRLSRLTSVLHCHHAVLCLVAVGTAGCAWHASPTLDGRATPIAELWDEGVRVESRDLFNGPGGRDRALPSEPRLQFVALDTRGASPGYDVRDAQGRDWDVKLGPEAQVEVVVSRLLWAVGFHQLPTYYVPHWTLAGGPRPGAQAGARFRMTPDQLDRIDRWAWSRNPFVGTRQLRGLFVLMVIVNNWDLKTSQNAVFESTRPGRIRRQYVVQDLGGALGRTRWLFPGTKGDVDDFVAEPFIDGVRNGIVDFHYRRAWRHPYLADEVTPEDVRWICSLLGRLSMPQWHDAFRAAGYDQATAERYIESLRARVHEGATLNAAGRGRHRRHQTGAFELTCAPPCSSACSCCLCRPPPARSRATSRKVCRRSI